MVDGDGCGGEAGAGDDAATSVTLEPGSVLLMAGDAQEEFLHRLPLDEGSAPVR